MKKLQRFILWLLALLITAVLCLQLYFFLQIGWWAHHNPSMTSFMRQQLSIMRKKNPHAKLQHQWVNYQAISNNLKRAVVAAEDSNFAEHEGIDWEALQQAYAKNNRRGKVVAGGSTITQQLAKNLFLSGQRSYLRKLQEGLITYMLEYWMDKQRILEIYLNVVEWGNGIFGAEAAAQHYFGVSAAALTKPQAANMAVKLPNPRVFDKRPNSSYLMRRTELIVRRMDGVELP